jgi:hypothetical protein
MNFMSAILKYLSIEYFRIVVFLFIFQFRFSLVPLFQKANKRNQFLTFEEVIVEIIFYIEKMNLLSEKIASCVL